MITTKMIPTLDTIIKASGIHPSRIFNIFLFGSRVYGTANSKSDWDVIMFKYIVVCIWSNFSHQFI